MRDIKQLLSLFRNEDLNWLFKLLKVITLIISLDKRVLLWQMVIIQRKLQKTIWNSHFPMIQTVRWQKCSMKFWNRVLKIKFVFQKSFWATHWPLVHQRLISRWTIPLLSGTSNFISIGLIKSNEFLEIIFVKLRRKFNKVSMSLLKKCFRESGHDRYRYTNWRGWRYRWLHLFYVDHRWWTWRHHWCCYNSESQFRWNCSKVGLSNVI